MRLWQRSLAMSIWKSYWIDNREQWQNYHFDATWKISYYMITHSMPHSGRLCSCNIYINANLNNIEWHDLIDNSYLEVQYLLINRQCVRIAGETMSTESMLSWKSFIKWHSIGFGFISTVVKNQNVVGNYSRWTQVGLANLWVICNRLKQNIPLPLPSHR